MNQSSNPIPTFSSSVLQNCSLDDLMLLHAVGELAPLDVEAARIVEHRVASDAQVAADFAAIKSDLARLESSTQPSDLWFDALRMQQSRRRMKLAMRQSIDARESARQQSSRATKPTRLSPWMVYPLAAAACLAFALSAWMYLDGPNRTAGTMANNSPGIGENLPLSTNDPDLRQFGSDVLYASTSIGLSSLTDDEPAAPWDDVERIAQATQYLADEFAN
jgi:hypothetical protein